MPALCFGFFLLTCVNFDMLCPESNEWEVTMSQQGNGQGRAIANATTAVTTGLAALIFSTQFFPIEHNVLVAWVLFVLGIVGIAWGYSRWRKI